MISSGTQTLRARYSNSLGDRTVVLAWNRGRVALSAQSRRQLRGWIERINLPAISTTGTCPTADMGAGLGALVNASSTNSRLCIVSTIDTCDALRRFLTLTGGEWRP